MASPWRKARLRSTNSLPFSSSCSHALAFDASIEKKKLVDFLAPVADTDQICLTVLQPLKTEHALACTLGHTCHVADSFITLGPSLHLTGVGSLFSLGDNSRLRELATSGQGSGGLAFYLIVCLWRRIQQVWIAGRAGWLPLNDLEDISHGPPL